ncbi:MAG TPA: TetR family transcriptional regulator [Usitatibacteraceae bacterium]|nr:TetR family transcriptional regulator [Usitatibacteraceae bacterium]
MAIKQRAIAVEDKEERRNALLDAAEALFLDHPDRMASVAEVAGTAGVAKGTVYLYFPSKEEMLLSLHERHMARFFAALMKLLDGRKAAGFDEVWATTRKNLVRLPGYLPLTGRCLGLMDRDIPTEAAVAFKIRVGQALSAAGTGLERHFPALGTGGGVTLLQHSYGLIVGLWQLMHPIERFGTAMERAELAMFKRDYERELEQALRALWAGTLGVGFALRKKRRSR